MELYKEILAYALMYGQIQISFSNKETDISQIVKGECYKTLQNIKAIIEDDSLEDKACFMKIEEIICALEEIGCRNISRHNFG